MTEANRIIRILHLSDLHFGSNHIFKEDDNETLGNSLGKDLVKKVCINNESLCLVAVTGDLVNKGECTKYSDVISFLEEIERKIKCPKEKIFIVPGNHDVNTIVKDAKPEEKLKEYSTFYRDFLCLPEYCCVDSSVKVKRLAEEKVIVVELNSCTDLKEREIEGRTTTVGGVIIGEMISTLKTELNKLKKKLGNDDFNQHIKIALLHHHAILLPLFLEKSKDEKSIIDETTIRSGDLLTILTEYGFHLILHGHKHYPLQYVHDPNSSWCPENVDKPILIVSGGCCGLDKTLRDDDPTARNTYNVIDVERTGDSEIKITVKTRGLNTFRKNRAHQHQREPDRKRWEWKDVKYRSFHFQFIKESNGGYWGWIITTSTKDFNAVENAKLTLKQVLQNCLLGNKEFCDIYSFGMNEPSDELILQNKYEYLCHEIAPFR